MLYVAGNDDIIPDLLDILAKEFEIPEVTVAQTMTCTQSAAVPSLMSSGQLCLPVTPSQKIPLSGLSVRLPATPPLLTMPSPSMKARNEQVTETPKRTMCKKLPWPLEYTFPIDQLSGDLRTAIDNKDDLRKPSQRYLRGMLVRTVVSDVIDNYIIYPDTEQKKDMARSIVKAFPHLKEENTSGGYGAWLASIVDSLKNRRRDMKDIFEVAVRVAPNNKRKGDENNDATSVKNTTSSVSESKIAKRKKVALPTEPELTVEFKNCSEEDDKILNESPMIEMQKMMQLTEQNRDTVKLKNLMKTTYSDRRTMIESNCPIVDIQKKYLALFSNEGLCDDFEEVCRKTKSILLANQNLEMLAPVIINMARKNIKRKLKSAASFKPVILLN